MQGRPDMSRKQPSSPRATRAKTIAFWLIAVGIIVPGGYGFIAAFIQFVRTLRTVEGGGFTIIPIVNYLMVTAGFVCLLIWAVAHGMFRDIERPKYTMLEREAQLDRDEGMTEADDA